jgi:hypothetical protein
MSRAVLRTVSDKKLLIILNYHGTLCGGLAAMQIHSLMQPGAFGPEAIAVMGDALDAALKELQDIGQSDVQSEAVRETIAVRIIGAARLGERDPGGGTFRSDRQKRLNLSSLYRSSTLQRRRTKRITLNTDDIT